MRHFNSTKVIPALLAACAFCLSACMKDKVTRTYQVYVPIYKSLAEIRADIKSTTPQPIAEAGKMTVFGNYIFLSDVGKGIHVIDNSDPSQPKNVSFINVPGNEDIAIRGSALYADAYGDLVTFDISDPRNAVAKNFQTNVFPDHSIYVYSNSPDGFTAISGWMLKDTTVVVDASQEYGPPIIYTANCPNCAFAANAPTASKSPIGTNGSTARFSIIGHYMYAVGYSELSAFDIGDPWNPSATGNQPVDFHVETIYPFKDQLFVGTNSGVFIYDVTSSPAQPQKKGQYTHVRGCDPVIADNDYAYVTLNDSSACLGFNNELQIVDIHNLDSSYLVESYQLTHPIGLAKDGNLLLICDGKDGLKIFDAGNVKSLQLLAQVKDQDVYDVIAWNGRAIVLGNKGIMQYDYSDPAHVQLISKF